MLYRAAQAMAYLEGRRFATPADFKQLVVPVFSHRVVVNARYSSTLKKVRPGRQYSSRHCSIRACAGLVFLCNPDPERSEFFRGGSPITRNVLERSRPRLRVQRPPHSSFSSLKILHGNRDSSPSTSSGSELSEGSPAPAILPRQWLLRFLMLLALIVWIGGDNFLCVRPGAYAVRRSANDQIGRRRCERDADKAALDGIGLRRGFSDQLSFLQLAEIHSTQAVCLEPYFYCADACVHDDFAIRDHAADA